MNQELLDLLRSILSQVIAGVPFGAILEINGDDTITWNFRDDN